MGMGQHPGLPPAGGGSDEMQFGPSGGWRPRLTARLCRPLARRLALGIAALAMLAVAAFVVTTTRHLGHHRPAVAHPAVAGHPQAQPWWAGARPVVATDAGHPLLGTRSGWELFGVGPGVLLRIQWAVGRVTRTAIPALQSGGPVFFVVGPHQAIIRPLDFVPGYLVSDDQPARVLPAALGTAGPAFPGPRPGQVWVQSTSGAKTVMSLMTTSGARIGPSIRLPAAVGYDAVPDGRGYLAVELNGAAYDVRPGGLRRVAAGTLTATGPSAWLVVQCPGARRCAGVVVNPATGTRRILSGEAARPDWPPGITSPDGHYAAVLRFGPGQTAVLYVINLGTGSDRRVAMAPASQDSPGLAWSPDSRWLFAATEDGALHVIDPRTGQVRGPGIPLPPVTYLAVRSPAPAS